MHLIESSRKLKKIPRVVFASTATVYGLKHNFPVSEKSKPDPATTYDLHKLFAEQQLSLASRQNIVSAVSLRLANVYGPSLSESGSNDRGILNKVVRSSLKGLDISIYGGGNLVRDYVYIDDIINAFLLASTVSHDISGEFNVASGVGTTLKDAFKLVISQVKLQTNSSSKIIFTEWPDSISPIEKRNFVGSIDRICKMINWKPSISLAEGLKRTVSHYARTRL